jgi:GNAT superfamily N-acetyltransferase
MIYREATIADIAQIQVVRNAVKENMLSDPSYVTDADCLEFLTVRGKGWVCAIDEKIVGFAIADLVEHNIWALFVDPAKDKKGIGKELHRLMLDWYFTQTDHAVWLGTAPNTRAELFYSKQGWRNVGVVNKGEVKFEMTKEEWENAKRLTSW